MFYVLNRALTMSCHDELHFHAYVFRGEYIDTKPPGSCFLFTYGWYIITIENIHMNILYCLSVHKIDLKH